MKIERIHLTAFRSAKGLTLNTNAKRVLIAGRNHSGKSSTKEAISWVLTGLSSVTDGRGLGAEALIPTGMDHCAAVLEIEGIGGVSRSFGPGEKVFACTSLTGDSTTQQAALFIKLNTSPELVQAVTDTNRFLRLHHSDAKNMVLQLLDVKVTIDGAEVGLEGADLLYEKAFDARKMAKQRLKSFTVPVMPQSPMEGAAKIPTVEQVEKQLQGLRDKLEAESGAAGVTVGRRSELQARLATIKGLTPYKGDLSAEECDRQIGILEGQVRKYEDELEAAVLPAGQSSTVQTATLYRKTIAALVEHRPTKGCVLDKEVPCETAKIHFTNRSKALQALLDGLQEGDEAPATPQGGSPLQEARGRLQRLRTMQARYLESGIAMKARDAEIDRLGKELLALPDTSKTEADIAAFRTRIQNGERLLNSVRSYWTAVYNHQEGAKKRLALEEEVKTLEARCDLLGPNGIRAEALQSAIGTFQDLINPVTGAFGWTVKFEVDPWQVVVNDRPVQSFSESEQYLVGMAIQLAIAQVSGLSFAVVDRLDVLDVEHRKIATDILMKADLQQILILSTRENEQKLPSAQAGLIAHRLRSVNGWTEIVESVGV